MFDNIGHKIKKVSKILCWVGILLAIINGVLIIFTATKDSVLGGGSQVIYGIMTMIVGSLLSWITSLFGYGFGQLIVDTAAIRTNTGKSKDE